MTEIQSISEISLILVHFDDPIFCHVCGRVGKDALETTETAWPKLLPYSTYHDIGKAPYNDAIPHIRRGLRPSEIMHL
jgi:hypothetical protein